VSRPAPDGVPSQVPVVRLRGASIGYDERPVVRGVDLDLAPGEVLALLGANGSGKSTLVKGILGLARVLSGSVELFGVPAHEFHDRFRIGYVPQRHTAGGTIPATVREVVSSGRLSRSRWWARPGAADREAVERALRVVGLEDRARSSLAELSGGQQRRVLIARALAGGPEVLVMDEPTAGVDASSRRALAATMRRLVDEDVTMLVVTHEVGPMAALITRSIVMHEGRVSYDGPLPTSALPTGDHVHHDENHHPDDSDGTALPMGWLGNLRIGD